MQKVSKQSLAMIALSILLAISIALTFTFAALSDKKTATGTITFSGASALLINNAEEDYTFAIAFDGTGAPKVSTAGFDTVAVSLADSSTTSNVAATFAINVIGDTDGTLKTALAKYIKAAETMSWNGKKAGEEVVKVKDTFTMTQVTDAADLALLSSATNTMTVTVSFAATVAR